MCYKITIKPACGLHVVRITEPCGESELECDLPIRIRSYALDHYVLCPKCSARREEVFGPGMYIFDRIPQPVEHHPSEASPTSPLPPKTISPIFGLPASPRDSMVLVRKETRSNDTHRNTNRNSEPVSPPEPTSPTPTPRRRDPFQSQTSTREKRAGRILLPPRPVSGRVNPRAEAYRRAREWVEQNRRSTILEEDEGGETEFSSGSCSQPDSEDERFVRAERSRLMRR